MKTFATSHASALVGWENVPINMNLVVSFQPEDTTIKEEDHYVIRFQGWDKHSSILWFYPTGDFGREQRDLDLEYLLNTFCVTRPYDVPSALR